MLAAALAVAVNRMTNKLVPESSLPNDLRQELNETFGFVPSFARVIQPAETKLWWSAVRDFQLSDKTALDGKVKELIGLGVAATIPCHYCVLFHTEAARLNGATDQEIQESIFMASLTRMGSTLLNGSALDPEVFDKEMAQIVSYLKEKGGNAPAGKPTAPVRR
jgi:AhpD family alkylhydroperoxidase